MNATDPAPQTEELFLPLRPALRNTPRPPTGIARVVALVLTAATGAGILAVIEAVTAR